MYDAHARSDASSVPHTVAELDGLLPGLVDALARPVRPGDAATWLVRIRRHVVQFRRFLVEALPEVRIQLRDVGPLRDRLDEIWPRIHVLASRPARRPEPLAEAEWIRGDLLTWVEAVKTRKREQAGPAGTGDRPAGAAGRGPTHMPSTSSARPN